MTIPIDPPPFAGLAPVNATDLNTQLGMMLRFFINSKKTINQWRDWLAGIDLTKEPYYFDSSQDALIKSAINGLDDSLDAIDMTFVNRLAGPF